MRGQGGGGKAFRQAAMEELKIDYTKRLKEFIFYYKGHMRYFLIDMAAVLASTGVTMIIPLLTYRIFEIYLANRQIDMIIWSSAVLLLLALSLAVMEFVSINYGHILGIRIESDMRNDLFRHLQKLSFNYFDRNKTGHIMSRLTNDLSQISELAHHGPEGMIKSILTIIGAFFIMLYLNWKLTLFTMLPLPLIIVWGVIFRTRMRSGFRDIRKKLADINAQVENSVQGIREVKSFTNEAGEIARFGQVNLIFQKTREQVMRLMAYFHSGIMFMIQTYSLIYVAAGAILMYYDENTTLLQVMTFMMYARYFTMPIFQLLGFMEQMQLGFAAFERFCEVVEEEPDIQDAPDAISEVKFKGEITFEQVFFKYPKVEAPPESGDVKSIPTPPPESDKWILENVNIHIKAGENVALVGESGAGKTTLAALIPRFYDVSGGKIKIDGIPIKEIAQQSLRSQIGIVRQTPFLFDTTIRENIRFGRLDATEEEIVMAAKEANIYDFIMSLPDGLDSMVGEHGVLLSGGQRQRISIARVFLKNPAILIFDEATSALDNESEALVQQSMEQLCHGRTTIVIAHRLSTVRHSDHIYCLRDGRVIEHGSHAELLAIEDGYYKKLYTMHTF
ncbi:MAG: ABC transporter ATP-binding protein/permease [Lentisphaeria bacterium]|nr:ABC transporter ATP-binding protein/permease [Lentisphaeria bacterium]